jgi:hypothetical protein
MKYAISLLYCTFIHYYIILYSALSKFKTISMCVLCTEYSVQYALSLRRRESSPHTIQFGARLIQFGARLIQFGARLIHFGARLIQFGARH